jgi:predicted alpha/beta superfamily hydrolase
VAETIINAGWLTYDEYRAGQTHTVTGHVRVLPGVHSPQLGNERDVIVYLPPRHGQGDRRYPVLYMQDGQNLFDRGTGFGGEEWCVDETLETLAAEGLEAIAVGLPHSGDGRIAEYSPFARRGQARGDDYLDFLVDTVKPLVDAAFRTQPDRAHTGLFGSSMGGLISLYGFFRRPAVFGLAGSMSPALWFSGRAIYDFVRQVAAPPGRIYLDHGTHENSAARMARLLREKGYQDGLDLRYVEEPGGEHRESAWARRLPDALRFLLRPYYSVPFHA